LFSQTFQYTKKKLVSFSIIFISFVCLFYLLFNSNIWSGSSLLATTKMLFDMTLLNFDTSELTRVAAFLGPFCFSWFIDVFIDYE
jgi:hypothetical protein